METRLESVLKASCEDVLKTFLEEVLEILLEEVLKTSGKAKNCYAEHVLKTSWKTGNVCWVCSFINTFPSLSSSKTQLNLQLKLKFGCYFNMCDRYN